jgi:hypothetical protein
MRNDPAERELRQQVHNPRDYKKNRREYGPGGDKLHQE